MQLLVDTSAYSRFMRGDPEIKVAIQEADEIYVNSIVLGAGSRFYKRLAPPKKRSGIKAIR